MNKLRSIRCLGLRLPLLLGLIMLLLGLLAPPAVVVTGGYSCFVGDHIGVDDGDARTTTDLICGELEQTKAPPGAYDVRFGKLGTRILLVVRERTSGQERRAFLQTFDEAAVAVPRVVGALVHHKSVDETQDVDNVISADVRAPKSKSVSAGGYVGLIGMTGAGLDAGASAGIDAALVFRKDRFTFGGQINSSVGR